MINCVIYLFWDVSSVHEEIKLFKWDICDFGYFLKKYINQHVVLVHDGKKPFKNYICDYSCFQKGHMNKHVASVHELKKTFKCELCAYCCSNKNMNSLFCMQGCHALVKMAISEVKRAHDKWNYFLDWKIYSQVKVNLVEFQ